MKAILVGGGGTSRELLQRLGEMWEVTVVDPSPERLASAAGLGPFRTVAGDGSSRVILRRAGLEEADALVAASNDDEVNLEACRLALDAEIRRVFAVAHDPERVDDYRRLGVTAICPASLAARRIEIGLETRRFVSMAFADGRAEAIEFRIAPDSVVCGKALKDLHARSWIVGAILRDNQLVIPHGETSLQAGDLVTVVGAGADFGEMVKVFTSGEGRFPLGFGKRVAVALDERQPLDGAFGEAVHLVRNTRASSLVIVHRELEAVRDETLAEKIRGMLEQASEMSVGVELRPRPVRHRPTRALGSLPGAESVGLIVVKVSGGGGAGSWWRTVQAASMARRTSRPVLLSRGTHPYRRILVPARRTAAGRAAVRAAIDLAEFVQAELHAPAVTDPAFISGAGDPVEERRAIDWVQEEAAIHGVDVRGSVRRGNPVRVLRELGEETDLLVLGIGDRGRRLSMRVGIAELVARSTTRSVLFVPAKGPA